MKSSFGISVALHALVFVGMFWSSGFTRGDQRPLVYQVNLVEMPAPPPVTPDPAPPRQPVREPEPEPEPETPRVEPVPRDVPAPEIRSTSPGNVALKTPATADPVAIDPDPEPEPEPEVPDPEPGTTDRQAAAAEPPPVEAAAVPAARQLPPGKSTEVSSASPIFTEYAYYRVAMRNKIAAVWSPPHTSSALVATVAFTIVRSGHVSGVTLVTSSGLPFFDRMAVRAINDASPLPALPSDFPDDSVQVTFEFAYNP